MNSDKKFDNGHVWPISPTVHQSKETLEKAVDLFNSEMAIAVKILSERYRIPYNFIQVIMLSSVKTLDNSKAIEHIDDMVVSGFCHTSNFEPAGIALAMQKFWNDIGEIVRQNPELKKAIIRGNPEGAQKLFGNLDEEKPKPKKIDPTDEDFISNLFK